MVGSTFHKGVIFGVKAKSPAYRLCRVLVVFNYVLVLGTSAGLLPKQCLDRQESVSAFNLRPTPGSYQTLTFHTSQHYPLLLTRRVRVLGGRKPVCGLLSGGISSSEGVVVEWQISSMRGMR